METFGYDERVPSSSGIVLIVPPTVMYGGISILLLLIDTPA